MSAAKSTDPGVGAPTNWSIRAPQATASKAASTKQPFATFAKSRKAEQGFTLIELLIVIAILLTIAAIAVPSLLAAVEASKVARAVGDIRTIEDDIALYQVMNNKLPDTLADVGDDALLDPWHNPYQYLNHSGAKGKGGFRKDRFLVPLNDDYDLYSMGKDGQTAGPITAKQSQDDVIRAGSGSYIGLASQF